VLRTKEVPRFSQNSERDPGLYVPAGTPSGFASAPELALPEPGETEETREARRAITDGIANELL
jgi:hypothetical protein